MPYPKPPGYRYLGLKNGSSKYVPNNGFISGSMNYAAGAQNFSSRTFNFTAAPANASSIIIQDGPPNNPNSIPRTLVFTYSGSPGVGVIPLVAGGGTATQAAAATALAFNAQVTNWTANAVGTGITFTSKLRGINPTIVSVGTTNMAAVTGVPSIPQPIFPGRFGKNYCILPG